MEPKRRNIPNTYLDRLYGNLYNRVKKKFRKFEKTSKNAKLNSWIKFIESPEVVDMSNKKMVKAKEILEEISQDEHERYLAELRENIYLIKMQQKQLDMTKGLKMVLNKVLNNKILEIAKKMLKQNFTLEVINSITKFLLMI